MNDGRFSTAGSRQDAPGLYILAKVVRKEVKGFRERVEEGSIKTYA